MIGNKCLVCGSSRLRADRALSGRLICTSCGNPYGVKKIGRKQSISNKSLFNPKLLSFIFLLSLVFFLVII